jgi:hypothetical protein
MTSPILATGTTVILSMAICETSRSSLRGIDFEPELIRIIAKHRRQTLHLWPPSATARAIEPAAALSRSGHEILVNLTRLQEEPLSEAL